VDCAYEFIKDLKVRLANRVQLTTDGHGMYLEAVEHAFGSEIDFAQLVKRYGQEPESEKRYSPAIIAVRTIDPISNNMTGTLT